MLYIYIDVSGTDEDSDKI